MMRSILVLSLVALAWPCDAAFAQRLREPVVIGDVRLSLFAAFSPPYTRTENRTVTLSDRVVSGRFESSYARGYGGGAIVEIVAIGPLRAVTSLSYVSRRGATVERTEAGDSIGVRAGASFVAASAGLALRIGDSHPDMQNRDLIVSLRAAPAYVLEIPYRDANHEKLRPLSAVGALLGFEAELPTGRGATIQLGVDDHVQFADAGELGRRVDERFARQGMSTSTRVQSPPAHIWILRIGVGFTFQ